MSWIENKVKALGIKFVVKEASNLLELTKANPQSIDDPVNKFLIAQISKFKLSSLLIIIFTKFIGFFMKKK